MQKHEKANKYQEVIASKDLLPLNILRSGANTPEGFKSCMLQYEPTIEIVAFQSRNNPIGTMKT